MIKNTTILVSMLFLVQTASLVFSKTISGKPFLLLPEITQTNTPQEQRLKQKLLTTYQKLSIKQASQEKQPDYINRLILESSPYLLQHAHNPINWFVWGKEALQKAKKENKLIFLSIGYSACHWCHRMERESFDNTKIANILNKNFIAIKVDRERRPDLDEFYAEAVQYFQGQQGWPMTLILTPEGKAFFAGGYYTQPELSLILSQQQQKWINTPNSVLEIAEEVSLQLQSQHKKMAELGDNFLSLKSKKRAIKDLLAYADGYHGGFGQSQKFPREPWLSLLLSEEFLSHSFSTSSLTKNSFNSSSKDAITALTTTLDHMAQGGIYDQLGGGFHRYTTDPYWKIPHFEKMLSTQAQLISLYLSAYQLTPNRYYKSIIEQTLNFVLQDMQSPNAGFYASIDADTKGTEGDYYLWDKQEFTSTLNNSMMDKKHLDMLIKLFDIDELGEINKKNVLTLFNPYESFSQQFKLPLTELLSLVDQAKNILLKKRLERSHPRIDKKIIMAWNALMITTLVQASQTLNKPYYLQVALKTAEFIWSTMSLKNKSHWYRINYQDNNNQPAQLQDYAYFLQALIKLYEETEDPTWLKRAEHISQIMINLFWDNKMGGFYQSIVDIDAPLPFRRKIAFDKMLISGQAIATKMFLRLAKITANKKYQRYAQHIFATFAEAVKETPSAYSGLLIAFQEQTIGQSELPQYVANGKVRVNAKLRQNKDLLQVSITLKIKPDWHINSAAPINDNLIPTQVGLLNKEDWQVDKVDYPQHQVVNLDFNQDQPLALYQGNITIDMFLSKQKPLAEEKELGINKSITTRNPIIKLRFQACSDKICLLAENITLYPNGL